MHQYSVQQAAIATNTTPKTVLLLSTPATRKAKLLEFGVGFDSVTSTDGPALVELIKATDDGTMTAATEHLVSSEDPAALVAAFHTATVEPAGITVLRHWDVPVGAGIVKEFAFGLEPEMAVSDFLAIRITTPQNQNADVYMVWQE